METCFLFRAKTTVISYLITAIYLHFVIIATILSRISFFFHHHVLLEFVSQYCECTSFNCDFTLTSTATLFVTILTFHITIVTIFLATVSLYFAKCLYVLFTCVFFTLEAETGFFKAGIGFR